MNVAVERAIRIFRRSRGGKNCRSADNELWLVSVPIVHMLYRVLFFSLGSHCGMVAR